MSGTPRFLTLADVAEVLNTSVAQVYALVRRGELPAIKIGGRGQWRVESPSWRTTSSGCTPRRASSSTSTRSRETEVPPTSSAEAACRSADLRVERDLDRALLAVAQDGQRTWSPREVRRIATISARRCR
jgi:excisionase family DNA binding protein